MNYRFENLEIAHSSHRIGELKEKELYRNGFESTLENCFRSVLVQKSVSIRR